MGPLPPRGTILAGMSKNNPFSNLGGPPAPTRESLAAEAKSHALAAALADSTIECRRLETELAESKAAAKTADRETRALRREIAATEDRASETRSNEIVAETLASLSARQRAAVPSYDEVLETLRGSPDAQALARMIVDARASRAEIPSLDEITETLRGSPSAQKLAKWLSPPARRAS
jgi:chromosome segregation ATPase